MRKADALYQRYRTDYSPQYRVNPHTCPVCNGRGYTRKTAAVVKDKKTVALGSGCPRCLGTGVIRT